MNLKKRKRITAFVNLLISVLMIAYMPVILILILLSMGTSNFNMVSIVSHISLIFINLMAIYTLFCNFKCFQYISNYQKQDLNSFKISSILGMIGSLIISLSLLIANILHPTYITVVFCLFSMIILIISGIIDIRQKI
ncbi:hypothetical protein [Apilactobacillus timberlakei]|uniref:hypothetical protein n=1 Tax=Apilactobacillus timberlakei TaxID=2008380 RepID=UPI00112C29B3|nr:hypothetical protein [Apilactobacillus timberlakei]TPR16282.1 hypothetical protein DYZ95_07900 [Apilactobacillus timberlakei]